MRAFVFFFAIAFAIFWVILSIEHGRAVGEAIKKTIEKFFKGEKRKERGNHER